MKKRVTFVGRGGGIALGVGAVVVGSFGPVARGVDVSAPAILQWYEGSWKTIGDRTADIRAAGYGAVWTPPLGRADSGGYSVGYDVYDRFDLGSAGNPTHYGTENGIRRLTSMFHRAGVNSYIDLVWNHNGFTDWWSNDNGKTFLAAGGYPGFYMAQGQANNTWGDFHSPFASGDEEGKTSNLIDIDQGTNHQFVRNPVPGFANNLPAGTVDVYGRRANVAVESNRRFYTDLQGLAQTINLPGGGSYQLYSFNGASPLAGDPVAENATGYLMRNTQWLVQHIGADGFRLDATKHMPAWVLDYYDRAVFGTNPRKHLDGSTRHVFGFGEYYGSDMGALQARTLKNISGDTTLGGNRDSLDFPLYFAMHANLKATGTGNDWRNVVNASFDRNDGFANNGSQGVAFVQAHDDGLPEPDLGNVAYAYALMRPGNAIVYFKSNELASGSFPRDGRGDALGGYYGNTITNLVSLRNQYGRGNYQPRLTEKELLAYERENSALVLLNNRADAGFDSRTVQTAFAPGTRLVELTGNAASPAADPNGDIEDVLVVKGDGTVDVKFLRNRAPGTNTFTGAGYLIYGPKSPVGTLSVSGAGSMIAGGTPTAGTNGTTRLSSVRVVTGDSFTVTLNTSAVTLSNGFRDAEADGDNAIIRVDDGVDVNGSGLVDYRNPGDAVVYGFEEFVGAGASKSPGFGSASGNGKYAMAIDAASLAEGYHYVTARAFRKRVLGGPAIYTDFHQAVYVDRLKPVAAVESFAGNGNDRTVVARSADGTANNMHVLLNVPGNRTDAQVIASLSGGTQGVNLDVDQWNKSFVNLASGNHVITVVTYEMTGNVNVQRFPGRAVAGTRGLGVGDVDSNNALNATDMSTFLAVLQQNDGIFNPAADVDGDGHVTAADAFLMGPRLAGMNADGVTIGAYSNTVVNSNWMKGSTYNVSGNHVVYDVTAAVTNVPAGASLVANSIRGGALSVAGEVRLNAGSAGSSLGTLTITGDGSVDLMDNTLTLSGTSAGFVRQYVGEGKLGSSTPDVGDYLSIGYLDNGASTLVKLTLIGDANLDGEVTPDDYALVDKGFATGGAVWWLGDFNYDGVVNTLDFLLIDRTLHREQSPSAGFLAGREARFGAGYVSALVTSIPEPSGLAAAGAVAGVLLGLRNRTSTTITSVNLSSNEVMS